MSNSPVGRTSINAAKYLATAVVTGVVTYFALFQQATDTANAEASTKTVNYVVNRDGIWDSTSPVDEVSGAFVDKTGERVVAISRQAVDLYNFGLRDVPEFVLQIDATLRDGKLPRLLGKPSVTVDGSEDFEAERTVEVIPKGGTLSLIVHFTGLNQTAEFSPARKVALYFAGREAPNLAVSVRGKGVKARADAYRAYSDSLLAREPWYESHRVIIETLLILCVFVVASGALLLISRARHRRCYKATPLVIDQTLQQLHADMPPEGRSATAAALSLAVWNKAYLLQNRIDRRLSVKPDARHFPPTAAGGQAPAPVHR